MIVRSHLEEITKRANEPRKFIQVVYGPRQVGKTTLIIQLIKQLSFETMFVTANDVPTANNQWIRESWDLARRKLQMSDKKEFLLIIDEIQKINNWTETVKKNGIQIHLKAET